MITKASDLKKKERKRSEKKFVRNLTKISFLDSTLHSKNNWFSKYYLNINFIWIFRMVIKFCECFQNQSHIK